MVDAAHNDDGVSSLQAALRDLLVPSAGKPVLVFGVLSDKDYSSMVARLAPWVRSVVLTTPLLAERALAPQKLAPLFKKRGVPVQMVPKIPQALATAAKTAGRNGWVLVAGSLYLVGPARQRLIKRIRPKL